MQPGPSNATARRADDAFDDGDSTSQGARRSAKRGRRMGAGHVHDYDEDDDLDKDVKMTIPHDVKQKVRLILPTTSVVEVSSHRTAFLTLT